MSCPYLHVFQSGVLFLAYRFGLPVIATDVGSVREDIVEGKTGYLCEPGNSKGLAEKIDLFFDSDLYRNLESRRDEIKRFAQQRYSWETIGLETYEAYKKVLKI